MATMLIVDTTRYWRRQMYCKFLIYFEFCCLILSCSLAVYQFCPFQKMNESILYNVVQF